MIVTFARNTKEKPGYWEDDEISVEDGDIVVLYLEKLPKDTEGAFNVCIVRVLKDAPEELAKHSVLEGLKAIQEVKKKKN